MKKYEDNQKEYEHHKCEDNEYIIPNYETISVIQKRNLIELMNSSLLNAFSEGDYYDILNIFDRIIKRLEKIEKDSVK